MAIPANHQRNNEVAESMNLPCAQRTVVIQNEQGLHARPAQLLARMALTFESKIEIVCRGQRVDAKSILHLLTLGAVPGTELVIEAHGPDAEAALDAIVHLVESDFAADEIIGQQSTG
ncbi:MAG: HPr family phosphocarrier protein [Bythopirellula sp.]|nr:HPr family phosphocarrier protein [Bythopirellula sp.]